MSQVSPYTMAQFAYEVSAWTIAQLAYDRVRKVLRQDGMNSSQVEAWLENACQQVLGLPLHKLEDNHLFALHLEQTVQGNAYPHY
jgi:hypothetical protein